VFVVAPAPPPFHQRAPYCDIKALVQE